MMRRGASLFAADAATAGFGPYASMRSGLVHESETGYLHTRNASTAGKARNARDLEDLSETNSADGQRRKHLAGGRA